MLTDLLNEAQSFRTLEEVMKWAFARTPPAELVNIIAQDEYTLDAVIRVSPDVFLAFDTT
ncbi:MAG TPA: hypothetical protein VNO70_13465 [Blastocatellia bacterium]|nr:hypothetical protein [Blastocatellia bacterium]